MEARECKLQSNRRQTAGAQVPQRSVSLVPMSSDPRECRYKVRRPLFTQHTSILKKMHAADSTAQGEPRSDTDYSLTGMRPLSSPKTRLRDEQFPHRDCYSSGYRSRMSPLSSSTPSELRPHNSVLQAHPMSTPVRPWLSSTVLNPRYTPLSSHRKTQAFESIASTPYQTEYWACAIPKDPPPTSSGRNPQQDYEALLDYTYPLRPAAQVEDWHFQDSGIEVDHLYTGQSLNLSFAGTEQPKDPFCLGPSSSDLLGSPFPETATSPVDCKLSKNGPQWSKQKNPAISCFSSALITLPLDRGHQDDEEFRALPEKMELLQQLSQQVHETAALLHSAFWDTSQSHCPHMAQEAQAMAQAPVRREESRIEDLVDSLRGPELHSSLMEHITVFCSHLEQLVHWLYAASQKIEQLTPPTVDIQSVKSSLTQYQNFQRDVNSHMPLTSSVLQTGRLLLSCINCTSPVLRDTLLLIESQSRLLERHTEHFFSSILSAMDNLTQPHTETTIKGRERPENRATRGSTIIRNPSAECCTE